MKLPRKHKVWLLGMACGLLTAGAAAQPFRWESTVGPAPQSGYHKILLTPAITSTLRADFTDVRLYDRQNAEVPYLLYKDEARKLPDRFVTYPIVEKQYRRSCCSFITVRNTLSNSIDHIVLEVNNADASRRMTLSGSYDKHSWFAVKDQYSVASFDIYEKGEKKTTSLLRFDFPLTDYAYYKFEFDDWTSWWNDEYPVLVVRAGYLEPGYLPGQVIALPQPVVEQTDSAQTRQSVVRIRFAEPQYADHLRLAINRSVAEKKDYYRAASLYEVYRDAQGGEHSRLLASTILSSRHTNEISLGGRRVKELLLRINNEDDKPLHIDTVEAFQTRHYLVPELKAGEVYTLRYGSDSIPAPVYDLRYFKDQIPDQLPELTPSGRKDMTATQVGPGPTGSATGRSIFSHTAFIWGAIIVVILVMALLSRSLLKSMNRPKE